MEMALLMLHISSIFLTLHLRMMISHVERASNSIVRLLFRLCYCFDDSVLFLLVFSFLISCLPLISCFSPWILAVSRSLNLISIHRFLFRSRLLHVEFFLFIFKSNLMSFFEPSKGVISVHFYRVIGSVQLVIRRSSLSHCLYMLSKHWSNGLLILADLLCRGILQGVEGEFADF